MAGVLSYLSNIVSYTWQTPSRVPVEVTASALTSSTDITMQSDKNDPYSVATALRCMQIIASAVAGCPLKAINTETGEPVHIDAFRPSGTSPTNVEIVETIVLHLAGWGNAYLRKQREKKTGRIIGLGPIHPSAMVVEYDAKAQRVGMPIEKRFLLANGERLTAKDILHIPGPSDDGVLGLSVVSKAARVLSAAREGDKTAERLGKQGLRINGILSTTDTKLNGDQADSVQKRWQERTAGVENAGKVAVLTHGLKFEQIDMSPADAQFLESRRFNVTEVARLFGVPGWMIGDQEKSTSWGTGMEQQFISFVTLTLKPYMQRIERRVTQELLDYETTKAEFKVEGLLRGDSKSRAAFYTAMTLIGAIVPDEIREFEDMPPVPWGAEPYRPYNEPAPIKESDDDGTD